MFKKSVSRRCLSALLAAALFCASLPYGAGNGHRPSAPGADADEPGIELCDDSGHTDEIN